MKPPFSASGVAKILAFQLERNRRISIEVNAYAEPWRRRHAQTYINEAAERMRTFRFRLSRWLDTLKLAVFGE